MSVTQRYWLVWSPGLILAGFFSLWMFCAMFITSYVAYYGHRNEWGLGKFAALATALMLVLFFLATARVPHG